MSSTKKIEANRQNSKKSTGPRTKKGKEHTSRNALTFGIYAGPQLLPGESSEQYNALLASLDEAFLPQGPIEGMYVTQIAGDMTRLKRVDIAEYAFIGKQVIALAKNLGDINSEVDKLLALHTVLSTIASQPYDDSCGDNVHRQRKRILRNVKENLDALRELQGRRSMEVQPRLTEARPQMIVAPRLLAAPVDTAQEVAPENAVAENAESEKQSQKTATKQGVDFLASRFFRPLRPAFGACAGFIQRRVKPSRSKRVFNAPAGNLRARP